MAETRESGSDAYNEEHTMKYKLNVARDVDTDEPDVYILNLPYGFRFDDSHEENPEHVRGFDTMAEVRAAARDDVIACACRECAGNTKTRHEKP